MLKRSLTKVGLGAALLAGFALVPAAASAQAFRPRVETVDHHGGHGWGGHGGGHWGGGHWGGGWHGYGYPAYGGGLGLGFYLGTAPAYNYYYGAPAYPAVPAYPPAGTYAQPAYPPPTTYGSPGYPPANQYSTPAPAYPPANSYPPTPYQQPY